MKKLLRWLRRFSFAKTPPTPMHNPEDLQLIEELSVEVMKLRRENTALKAMLGEHNGRLRR